MEKFYSNYIFTKIKKQKINRFNLKGKGIILALFDLWNFEILKIIVIITFLSSLPLPAKASVLEFFSPQEKGIYAPVSLLDVNKRKISLSKKFENIYKSKISGNLTNSFTFEKNNFSFIYPQKIKNLKYVIDINIFEGNSNLFTDDFIKNTRINLSGDGYSIRCSGRYYEMDFGMHTSRSTYSGNGYSKELIDKIELLSSNTVININTEGEEDGFQIKYNFLPDYFISYYENNFKNIYTLKIQDEDDEFVFPVETEGRNKEITFISNLKNKKKLLLSCGSGKNNALNPLYYNSNPAFGKNYLSANYTKSNILYLTPGYYFGMEKYNGFFEDAGFIALISGLWNFVGGDYLYEIKGSLNYNKYIFAYKTKYKKIDISSIYSFLSGDGIFHFEGAQFFWFNLIRKNESIKDYLWDIKIHNLSLSFSKKITKYTTLKYSFSQTIPNIKEKIKKEEKPPVEPDAPSPPKKKHRGGNAHNILLEYEF